MDIKGFFFTRNILLLFTLISAILSSCNFESSGKKKSTGSTNEILVVTNSKTQWESAIGETIRDFFGQEMPGMPQSEPLFNFLNIPENKLNKTFKTMHSIFIVDINEDFKQPLVEMKRDLWSEPQMVIKITAPDVPTFITVFLENQEKFLDKFDALEIERINKYYHMGKSLTLMKKLERKFGFSLEIPGGFAIAKETENFIWLRQTMHKTRQDAELGILIYTYNYNDTSDFNPRNIISVRDSLTRAYVPGPSKGSYMIVSQEVILPEFERTRDFVTGFAVETRGLWRVENDFMGGPFISYTITDPERERIITLDGYVYNPNQMKRNFIRQLEAIFHTLEFADKQESS